MTHSRHKGCRDVLGSSGLLRPRKWTKSNEDLEVYHGGAKDDCST